jgi:hypothetical protein
MTKDKKLEKVVFKYKGWVQFVPVYLDDVDNEEPLIIARHWSLNIPLWFAWRLEELRIAIGSLFGCEPAWAVYITGECKVERLW